MIQQDKTRLPLPKSLEKGKDKPTDIEKKRAEVIALGKFPKGSGKYSDAYKRADIKKALQAIYYKKCCYCETKIRQPDVEHFRPKSTYHWLAYSWDNLLLACPDCNRSYKNARFDIAGKQVHYQKGDLSDIHILASSKRYLDEQALLLHPELDNPEEHLCYDEFGKIYAMKGSKRGEATIEICGLDAEYLEEARKELVEMFEKKIENEIIENINDKIALSKAIKTVINGFKQETEDPRSIFLGFRRHLIKAGLLKKIITQKLP